MRKLQPDPAAIRANAERFSRARFLADFQAAISESVTGARREPPLTTREPNREGAP
jgi:hypothetical protein